MMPPGLHHQISMKRLAASELARQAMRPHADPRTAHEQREEACRLEQESADLAEHAQGNEQVMEGLLHQINYLAKSPHKSRHRSIVITEIENAVARLQMENGAPEPERKFQVIEPTPPINGQAVS